MKVKEIISTIEELAPLRFQEDWDNSGFQVGDPESEVSGILVCLDVTEDVLDEAVACGCNMVVSHHPLLFTGLKHITGDSYQEKCVVKAIKEDLCIYSSHTSLDNAPGGVNHKIAELIGLTDVRFLSPSHSGDCGSGVVGILPEPVASVDFLKHLKEVFHVECLMHSEPAGAYVRKVALCGGAGSFLLKDAASCGADCFITGDMSYHNFFGLEDGPMAVAMGHYQSEKFTIDLLAGHLCRRYPDFRILMTDINTNPIRYC